MAAPREFIEHLRALQRRVRPVHARPVSLSVLTRIARHFAPRLSLPRYRCTLPRGTQKVVDKVADFLQQQPLQESAYYLSCVYAILCKADYRRDLAMYFTPPALAQHIVSRVAKTAGSLADLCFMDPACGGAAFLLPAVVLLRDQLLAQKASPERILSAVNRQVVGVEKDPTLAELARQFIRIALHRELAVSRQPLGPVVRVGDTLNLYRQGRLPSVNAILCNPPYRKIRAAELARFRREFPDSIAGQPNLYTMFMRMALQVVAPGGLVALLTPTSYFSGSTYQPIRSHYARGTSVLRIDLIHEREDFFLDVEHDVAALLVRRRLSKAVQQRPEIFAWDETTGWTDLGEITLSADGSPWHLPRDNASAIALATSKQSTWSLEQYGYKARVGAYVWNRDKRKTSSTRPTGRDRDRSVPVIWANQIGQDGQFRFISKGPKERKARYVLLREGERHGVIGQDCVLLQRTSSRAQRRRLVAAALPRGFARKYGGFIGENHVIILEPTCARPALSKADLVRLLNSEFMRDLYSTTSGTTAVTTSGLHSLPLPDPHILKTRFRQRAETEKAVRLAFRQASRPPRRRGADAQAPRA